MYIQRLKANSEVELENYILTYFPQFMEMKLFLYPEFKDQVLFDLIAQLPNKYDNNHMKGGRT